MDKNLLEKFHQLPSRLKNLVFSPEAVVVIEELEDEYDIELGEFIMKLIVKEIPIETIGSHIMADFGKPPHEAAQLAKGLIEKIFKPELNYLMQRAKKAQAIVRRPQPVQKAQFTTRRGKFPSPFSPNQNDVERLRQRSETALSWKRPAITPPSRAVNQPARPYAQPPAQPRVPQQQPSLHARIFQNDDEFIRNLIKQFYIPIENEDQLRRFSTVVQSRLKGIRDDEELLEKLETPWRIGGMDLSSQLARDIMEAIQTKVAQDKKNEFREIDMPQVTVNDLEIFAPQPKESLRPIQLWPHAPSPKPKNAIEYKAAPPEMAAYPPSAKTSMPGTAPTPQPTPTNELEDIANLREAPQPQPGAQTQPQQPAAAKKPVQFGWSPRQTRIKPWTPPPPQPISHPPAALPIEPTPTAHIQQPTERPQIVGAPAAPAPVKMPLKRPVIEPPLQTPTRLRVEMNRNRPQITDIKTPSRPTGPIEELQNE